jgi:hypothetical protein
MLPFALVGEDAVTVWVNPLTVCFVRAVRGGTGIYFGKDDHITVDEPPEAVATKVEDALRVRR